MTCVLVGAEGEGTTSCCLCCCILLAASPAQSAREVRSAGAGRANTLLGRGLRRVWHAAPPRPPPLNALRRRALALALPAFGRLRGLRRLHRRDLVLPAICC